MSNPQLFKIGWLIDGSGNEVQKKVMMSVVDSEITKIWQGWDMDIDPTVTVIDFSRCIVLPPFVDCHVHLAMSGATDPRTRKEQLAADHETLLRRMEDQLHYQFTHGVLAVRDGGDQSGAALAYKTRGSHTKHGPVTIRAASQALHKKGRYGEFIGSHPETGESLVDCFEKGDSSGDHVKIFNSGLNSLTEFGVESASQFSREELTALVKSASAKGQKVMVHANGCEPVQAAVRAGCHSIEHGFFMGRENLQEMADRGTFWIPTAFTMKAFQTSLLHSDVDYSREVVEQNLEHQLEQLATARQLGVRVALGTDSGACGVLHGESVGQELKLFLKAGYSLGEAVQCATTAGADLLDVDTSTALVPGQKANFLVARSTPSMLPRKISYLEAIYLDGSPCDKRFFNRQCYTTSPRPRGQGISSTI
ncbi:MAG: amidohydrolase family protein [Thermodesulfobacteriota bacterium]